MKPGATPSDERASSPMRSLERALDVLDVLTTARKPLRLSEIARLAGLHVATAQRILSVLEKRGQAAQHEQGYCIGVAGLLNAHAFSINDPFSRAARPVMQELAQATELTVSLSVRFGLHRVQIARVEGRSPLRYQLPVGERLPLHLGAGKVLALDLSPSELDELFAGMGVIAMANGLTRTREQFQDELAQIRLQGYTVSEGERVLGTTAVAAPVCARDGAVLGSLQAVGLTADVPADRISQLVPEVRRAVQAVADRLSS